MVAGSTVLLGVTPELASLGQKLIAIDNHPDMIRSVWPGDQLERQALIGDWLHLPLEGGSWDNVIGDGCPVLLQYPIDHQCLFLEAARVLKPHGRLVMRCFVRPDAQASVSDLTYDVLRGAVGSFHSFKWRLAMSLCAEAGSARMAVSELHAIFEEIFPDRDELAATTGWTASSISTIDAYKNSDAIYSFPTLSALRLMVPAHLREISCDHGDYELAECCPLLTWERCT